MTDTKVMSPYSWLREDKTLTIIILSVISSLIQILYETSITYTTFAIENINNHPNPFHVNDDEESWLASVTHFGAIGGALMVGPLLGYFGRQPVLLFSNLPFAIGWLVIVSSPNVYCMYAGRVLTGIGQGLCGGVTVVYISEIAPAKIRGTLTLFSSMTCAFAKLLSYLLGAFISWNWTGVIYIGISLIAAVPTSFIPETPRWLLTKYTENGNLEQKEQAVQILQRIRKSEEVDKEIEEIQESLMNAAKPAPWTHLILKRKNLFCLLCCMFMQMVSQLGGAMVISLYSVSIFQAVHSDLSSDMQTIVLGCVSFLSNLLTLLTLDFIPRRLVTLISLFLQSLFLTALATYFYVNDKVDSQWAEQYIFWLPLLSLIGFEVFTSWSGGVISLMQTELFATDMRSRVVAWSTIWYHICMFVASKYFDGLTEAISLAGGFWFCAGVDFCGGLFYFLIVPESPRYLRSRIFKNDESLREIQ